jgi:hypothetical protein
VECVNTRPAAGKVLVPLGFRAVVRFVETTGNVSVIVRLMNRYHALCGIDNGTRLPCSPDEPVIKAGAADQEWWQIPKIAARENEVVESRVPAKSALLYGCSPDTRSNRGIRKR